MDEFFVFMSEYGGAILWVGAALVVLGLVYSGDGCECEAGACTS